MAYAHNLLSALQVSDGDKKSPRQISRAIHDTLADIFKKIGSKENTREVCFTFRLFKMHVKCST